EQATHGTSLLWPRSPGKHRAEATRETRSCSALSIGAEKAQRIRLLPEELTALVEHGYSITWSALSSSVCGIVRPSTFAVLRLMTNSNFVGCSTGRSAGLAPLRILST